MLHFYSSLIHLRQHHYYHFNRHVFSLDHVWHRNFGVFLKHACHQAVTADVINALWQKQKKHDSESQQDQLTSFITALNPHLADVAGPGGFLLAGRSQEDDREGLTIRRLHHDLKLQVTEALTCSVVCKSNRKQQSKDFIRLIHANVPVCSQSALLKGMHWRGYSSFCKIKLVS